MQEGLLALNLEEMQAIQGHYRNSQVRQRREEYGHLMHFYGGFA